MEASRESEIEICKVHPVYCGVSGDRHNLKWGDVKWTTRHLERRWCLLDCKREKISVGFQQAGELVTKRKAKHLLGPSPEANTSHSLHPRCKPLYIIRNISQESLDLLTTEESPTGQGELWLPKETSVGTTRLKISCLLPNLLSIEKHTAAYSNLQFQLNHNIKVTL